MTHPPWHPAKRQTLVNPPSTIRSAPFTIAPRRQRRDTARRPRTSTRSAKRGRGWRLRNGTPFFRLAPDLDPHRRHHHRRADGIDLHDVPRPFGAKRLGQRIQPRPWRTHRPHVIQRDHAGLAGNVDDLPPPLSRSSRVPAPLAVRNGAAVDGHHPVPGLVVKSTAGRHGRSRPSSP